MKKWCVLLVFTLLLTSLPTYAMAEDSLTGTKETAGPLAEKEETEEIQEETEETDETSEQEPQIHRADFPKAEDSLTRTEETAGSLAETEETQEETEETDETGEKESQLVKIYKAEKKLPEGWQTKKRRRIEDEITEVYTCPVRKSSVYMKFAGTFGITKMKVWIQVFKDGEWVNAANTEGIQLGGTIAFVFDAPYRYRIFARRIKGTGYPKDRRCDFIFVGLA